MDNVSGFDIGRFIRALSVSTALKLRLTDNVHIWDGPEVGKRITSIDEGRCRIPPSRSQSRRSQLMTAAGFHLEWHSMN